MLPELFFIYSTSHLSRVRTDAILKINIYQNKIVYLYLRNNKNLSNSEFSNSILTTEDYPEYPNSETLLFYNITEDRVFTILPFILCNSNSFTIHVRIISSLLHKSL